MGNTTSEPAPQEVDNTQTSVTQEPGSYKWPGNLYVETRDMAAASFLAYSFAYILDVARKSGLEGLQIDSAGHASKQNTSRVLQRSFTPEEVIKIIETNRDKLSEYYPDEFGENNTVLVQSLQVLKDRVTASGKNRPLTLAEFDDKHQDKEMVYGVTKDDINKRITLCFRGTDNQLAKDTNWSANLDIAKTKAYVPEVIKDKVSGSAIWFHTGFYNYIFGATATETDAPEKRKYDEILEDIKPLLAANPGYKLYVTGHSLGAALSTMVAFYLACDESLPKPITCINFASPRVGDGMYLEASTALEASKKLRFLRIVNDNDSIAMFPTFYYSHAGFQVRLYKDAAYEPEATYPKLVDTMYNRWSRTWGNSLFASFNVSYDHGEYRERVEQNKAFLEKMDLNELYANSSMTGFPFEEEWSPEP